MKNYKSIIFDHRHFIGSTGAVVDIYDKSVTQVASFEGFKKAYDIMLSPDGKLLCVSSPLGYIRIYSLETFTQAGSITVEKKNDNDGGMLFSNDGKLLYNVENVKDDLRCTVAVYNTTDFSLERRIELPISTAILEFEYDRSKEKYYVIGYVRGETGYDFVSEFCDSGIVSPVRVTKSECNMYTNLKCFENRGRKIGNSDVESITNRGFTLAKLYEFRKANPII